MTGVHEQALAHPVSRLLVAVTLAQLVIVVDAVSVEVALVPLGRDLSLSPAGLAWVVNGYTLAFGGLLLVGGRVADVWGRARTVRLGLTVFGGAALLAAVSSDPALFLVARVLQGAAAAFLAPASLGLLAIGMPSPTERLRGVARVGVVSAVGGSAAVVAAGLVTDHASWRGVFVIVAALALFVGTVLSRDLPTEAEDRGPRRFGLAAALAATTALGTAMYAIQHPGSTPKSAWALAVGAVVLLVVLERRSQDPLLPRRAANSGRPIGMAMLVVSNSVSGGAFFALALTMQGAWGWTASQAGTAFVPFGLALLAGTWIGARALARVRERHVLWAGALVMTTALVLLASGPSGESHALVFASLALLAFGASLVTLTLSVVVLHGAAASDAAVTGALLSVAQQLGIAVGVAIVSIALPHLGWRDVLLGAAGVALLGLTSLSLALVRTPQGVGKAYTAAPEGS